LPQLGELIVVTRRQLRVWFDLGRAIARENKLPWRAMARSRRKKK
jgi:hypothetical protein